MRYESRFNIAIQNINNSIASALEEIGQFGTAESQARTPVDTGRLRRDLGYKTDTNSVAIGTNVEYAPFVHEGSSRQKAQPFIKDGVAQNITEIINIVKRHNSNVGD